MSIEVMNEYDDAMGGIVRLTPEKRENIFLTAAPRQERQ